MPPRLLNFRSYVSILSLFLLVACGQENGGAGGSTPVTVKMEIAQGEVSAHARTKALASGALDTVASVNLTVTDGAGVTLASAESPVSSGQTVRISLEVPAGPNRIFIAEAFDAEGTLLFQGESAPSDLIVGVPAVVSIGMVSFAVPPRLVAIIVSPNNPVLFVGGQPQHLTATGQFSDGSTADVPIVWSSSDTGVATVDTTGLASGVSKGAASIIATSGSVSGNVTLTVIPPAPTPTPTPTLVSISVAPDKMTISKGQTQQFTATGTFSDGTTASVPVSWSSSDTGVATVDATGLASGVDKGATSITATSGSVSGNAALTVTIPTPTMVSISVAPDKTTIAKGQTQQFTATGTFSDGTTAGVPVSWSSSDTGVATVDTTGLASGVSKGATSIIATSGSVSGNVTLTVIPPTPTLVSISVAPDKTTIAKGQTQQFTATGIFSDGSTATVPVDWSSSDPGVATVDLASGLAQGVSAGIAIVTAISGNTSSSSTLTIAARTLVSISTTTTNPVIFTRQSNPFSATGTFSDGSVLTLSSDTLTAGSTHSCTVLADGTVRCWGDNFYGQLGDGSRTDSNLPVVVSGITSATAIAAGQNHTCALLADGNVKCWGGNYNGQLGNDGSRTSPTPVNAYVSNNAVALAAGASHTCALLAGGTIECWGSNSDGQLGNGGTYDYTGYPERVPGITSAMAITAGAYHTCALLTDGTVRCWGYNFDGELGDGGTTVSKTPVKVIGLSNATAITAGSSHTCALLADTSVQCWGSNIDGQLGAVRAPSSSVPVSVLGINLAESISAGGNHTCVLLGNDGQGTIQCWGSGSFGELGDGSLNSSPTPVSVLGIPNAMAISAGEAHTCALLPDGAARCWGYNGYGELGDGSLSDSPTPVVVSGISTALSVNWSHDSALTTVNDNGIVSGGTTEGKATITAISGNIRGSTTLPVVAPTLASISVTPADAVVYIGQTQPFTATGTFTNGTERILSSATLSAGISHACTLLTDGTIRCWGSNLSGQLGDGTLIGSITPVEVNGITGATAISAGGTHTCALLTDGTIRCWGSNGNGQLGDGSTSASTLPVMVKGITSAISISAGNEHTCALLTDGTVRCWGLNSTGQLGDGTMTTSNTPVVVKGITSVTSISAGRFHTCALLTVGTILCWGNNFYGQLGDGTTNSSLTPVYVYGIYNKYPSAPASAIAATVLHTCALLTDGTVRCWGYNRSGQLGNATTNDSLYPVLVSQVSSATAISVGGAHSCALISDGTIQCWGDNGNGALGDGTITTDATAVPVGVSGISTGTAISAGFFSTCALLADGMAQCWGDNTDGQLGDGSDVNLSTTPVFVSGISTALSVTWSSNSKVAIINSSGLAAAVQSPGETPITATSGGIIGSVILIVP